MNTIQTSLNQAQRLLADDEAKAAAEILLAYVLNKPRSYLYTWPDAEISVAQHEHYLALLHQRQQQVPVAYLTGYQEFWSLNFEVNEHTLIPRPDTEVLVEATLALPLSSSVNLLDLGTGSGCVAISLQHEKPDWHIVATDISPKALKTAQLNAVRLLPDSEIRWFASDWFAHLPTMKFDVIVSNPPYIAANDSHLEALQYEPRSALVPRGDTLGLADLQHLAVHASRYLHPGGYLLMEMGYDQATAMQEYLDSLNYQDVEVIHDYNDQPRVIKGRWVKPSYA